MASKRPKTSSIHCYPARTRHRHGHPASGRDKTDNYHVHLARQQPNAMLDNSGKLWGEVESRGLTTISILCYPARRRHRHDRPASPAERRKQNTDTCQCRRVVTAHRAVIDMAQECHSQTRGFKNTSFRDLTKVQKRGESWWLGCLGVGGGTVKVRGIICR